MTEIYYLLVLVLVSIGSSYITTQMPRLKLVFKRIFTRSKPTAPKASIAKLEQRITRLEQQLEETIKYAKKRDSDRTSKTKAIVLEYLKELQK